ncbi:hypothetical protein HUJ04_012041 [Dendroctonus ponderosae]|nr:hypothetical protein HUJ04_012041 [Dendroctonus ponderosae]
MSEFADVQSDVNTYSHFKIEYHDPTDTGRVVSQTFVNPQAMGAPLSKACKIISHVDGSGNNVARISIRREVPSEAAGKVILLSAGWDKCSSDVRQVSPSPMGSDSGIESDCADGSLNWLINYRLKELPPVPDAAPADQEDLHKTPTASIQPLIEVVQVAEGSKVANVGHNNTQRKPPFTYTELIEHALIEKRELTVSGIYKWISNHFPFYKANDDRWKNSVRHNLSINPHFRKGGKAVQGAGHLWTIAQRDEMKSWQMRQRINDFLNSQKNIAPEERFDKELQAATECILEEIESQSGRVIDWTVDQAGRATGLFQIERAQDPVATHDDIHMECLNIPEGVSGLQEFLAPPVPKQQLVNECGLGNDFFITDINPNQLELGLDEGIYDEMSLDYYGIKD